MKAIVFDTEVNSLESKEVVQLAWCEYDVSGDSVHVGAPSMELFQPAGQFEAGAVAVHGIIPADVHGCRPSAEATVPDCEYVIAHNVDFDCEVMGLEGPKRICTLALSRYLWPEFKSHTLSAMTIELFGMNAQTIARVKDAHEAANDVRLVCDLLGVIIQRKKCQSLSALHELSEVARIPTVMPFGKHKGVPIKDVPKDYVRWLLNQQEVDPYLRKALS